ncbi:MULTISPECIES: BID domain-containing T4SS effector [unclassified Bartonella]|uniref:BID domain-containing T4SS effector n=1 Tax=unclassified Bartonella TaxID=2645622 RepID=UPI00099A7C8A|nr:MULTISPECIES: BID domain-containing T4SS effector [unclassified Bartonella]AQX27893.1 Bartonella effector protein Bep3/2 [Bartonella sp. JB15]AQX29173.1 Bartonella effector protein Bep3/2 [Bartonella sp. JB63]
MLNTQEIVNSAINSHTIKNIPLHPNTILALQGYVKGNYSLHEFNTIMDTTVKALLSEVRNLDGSSVPLDIINAHHTIQAIINSYQKLSNTSNIEANNYCALIVDELQERRTIVASAINTHILNNVSLHPNTLTVLEEYAKGSYPRNELGIIMDSTEKLILNSLKNVKINAATINTINAHHRMKKIVDLYQEPLPEKFDSSYLKYLHECLFSERFEPIGHDNYLLTSKDDITVDMLELKKLNPNNMFKEDRKVQESLKKFDQILREKNNLKGLSRQQFIGETVGLFSFFNLIHPFKEDNEITQRLFFEKLAKAAGHTLDFSVVTKQRMLRANNDAIWYAKRLEEKGNVSGEVIEHLFEDISNSEKIDILKDAIYNEATVKCKDLNNTNIIIPRDNIVYTGTYKGSTGNAIMIDTKDSCVVCPKDRLTPKQLKELKIGGEFTFTVSKEENLDTVLIPEEKLLSLTDDEIIENLKKNITLQEKVKEIEKLSKILYKDPQILAEYIMMINKNPENYKSLSDQIVNDPKSISERANKKFQSKTDQKDIYKLGNAIDDYIASVKYRKNLIIERHNTEQKRLGTVVKMPSKEIQDILNLPKDMQKKALESSPSLHIEFNKFINNVVYRLSSIEYKELCKANYKALSESVGISEKKARLITKVVMSCKELCRPLKPVRSKQPQKININ